MLDPPYFGFVAATQLRGCDGVALVGLAHGAVHAWHLSAPLGAAEKELRRYYKIGRAHV